MRRSYLIPYGVLALAIATLPCMSESLPPAPDIETAALSATDNGGEAFRMHWTLSGFVGRIVGLFVPSSGDALITTVDEAKNREVIEFIVTSPKRKGDYMLYGARIDQNSGSTEAIWSRSYFRGKLEQSEKRIDQPWAMDYASAIHHLRWNGPERPTLMTIWDDGKPYAAEVVPLDTQTRKIGGEEIDVRGYLVRGAKPANGQKTFDDKIYLYFARDERSTPVEIVGKRGFIRVRIRLVEPEPEP